MDRSDQHHVSALHLIQTHSIFSHLVSANAVMFLIGSNSLRKFMASTVLDQIQHVISTIRRQHHQFDNKDSISIVTTFPCLKLSHTFPRPELLQYNIQSFNEQLFSLATNLNFTITDFAIELYHLNRDQLHINQNYSNIVPDNIFNYFEWLNSKSTSTNKKNNCRSENAIKRRNQRRHLRLAEKQANLYICRTISPPWTLKSIKTYLQKNQIQFTKLSPIRNNQLRVRFNNSHTLQAANIMLPQDFFSFENFSKMFPF